MMHKNDRLVTLFGKPGSGKTTFGDFLVSHHGFIHIALSRLLRDRKFLDEVGISDGEMQRIFATGETIASVGLFDWLDATIRMSSAPIVVDGYPREPAALERFNNLAKDLSARNHVIALHLLCPSAVAMRRIMARNRPDDTSELSAARLANYMSVQLPVFQELDASIERIETSESDLAKIASLLSNELGTQ